MANGQDHSKMRLRKMIEETLDDYLEKYFPKGDNRRGEAMVLYAKAQIEIDKARDEEIANAKKRENLNKYFEDIEKRNNINKIKVIIYAMIGSSLSGFVCGLLTRNITFGLLIATITYWAYLIHESVRRY